MPRKKEAEVPDWIHQAAQEIKDDLRKIAEINFGPIDKRDNSSQFMPIGIYEDTVQDGRLVERIWLAFMMSGIIRKHRVILEHSDNGITYIRSRLVPGEISNIEYINYLPIITSKFIEAGLKPIPGKI